MGAWGRDDKVVWDSFFKLYLLESVSIHVILIQRLVTEGSKWHSSITLLTLWQ